MRKLMPGSMLVVLFAIMQGCVVTSVHPLYRSQEDIIFDQGLIGRWIVADGETWEFTELRRNGQTVPNYLITITDDEGMVGVLVGRLVEIDERRFLDLFPYDFEYTATMEQIEDVIEDTAESYPHGFELTPGNNGTSGTPGMWFNNVLLVPTHTVLQVRRTGDAVGLAFIDLDWIIDHARDGTLELAYEAEDDDDNLLITASTDELRSFVRKYADDGEVFEFEELTRE